MRISDMIEDFIKDLEVADGSIKIKKVNITKSNYLMHIITNIGDKISSNEVDIFISNFVSYNIITEKEARLLKVATSDNVLTVSTEVRDKLRASIFKNMLLNLVED